MAEVPVMVIPTSMRRVGFWIAAIVAIVVCIFWGMGLMPKEAALLTLAVCAVSL